MTLFISRLILTVLICCVAYFALERVWTKKVDLIGWIKKPSEVIPIKNEDNEDLAGKQLPRPLIECSYQNKSIEGQLVDCSVGQIPSIPPIIIRNVGDVPVDYMDFRLYLALDEPMPDLSISWWNPLQYCDEPGYTVAFDYTNRAQHVHPKESFGLRMGQWFSFSAKKGSRAQALLKVYYGEPEPIVFKWSVNFK